MGSGDDSDLVRDLHDKGRVRMNAVNSPSPRSRGEGARSADEGPLTRPSATLSPLTRGEGLLCVILLVVLAACAKQESQEVTDTRDPIAIQYVGAPEAPVHKWAKEDSPVIAKFLNGESVSIMSRRGDWVEVRTAGATGFVHAADLADAAN